MTLSTSLAPYAYTTTRLEEVTPELDIELLKDIQEEFGDKTFDELVTETELETALKPIQNITATSGNTQITGTLNGNNINTNGAFEPSPWSSLLSIDSVGRIPVGVGLYFKMNSGQSTYNARLECNPYGQLTSDTYWIFTRTTYPCE